MRGHTATCEQAKPVSSVICTSCVEHRRHPRGLRKAAEAANDDATSLCVNGHLRLTNGWHHDQGGKDDSAHDPGEHASCSAETQSFLNRRFVSTLEHLLSLIETPASAGLTFRALARLGCGDALATRRISATVRGVTQPYLLG